MEKIAYFFGGGVAELQDLAFIWIWRSQSIRQWTLFVDSKHFKIIQNYEAIVHIILKTA